MASRDPVSHPAPARMHQECQELQDAISIFRTVNQKALLQSLQSRQFCSKKCLCSVSVTPLNLREAHPLLKINCFSLLLFSCSIMSDSLRPHRLQHAMPPCPSPTLRVYSDSCPLSRWCHPTILSSVFPFSSCLQSFPTSGSFLMSWLFASSDQSVGASVSASVLPMNIQDWFPLGWTGWISSLSRGLSRVFSNTTVQKHQLFRAQLSL